VLRQPLANYGLSGTRWTLAKLLQATREQLRLASLPGLSQLLRRVHICWKRARNYLHSPDRFYVDKLQTIRFHVLSVPALERVVFLFADELSFYRQPSLASAYEWMGRIQPLARLGLKSNAVWRVAGLLNAWNGQVLYEQGSQVSIPKLVKLYQQAVTAYPEANPIFIAEDNWPVHAHPDVLAALQPQAFPHGLARPGNWPTEPSPQAKRLNLPIRILFLPTYAPWTNPIEKLWKFVHQEVLHLHRFEDDWPGVKQAVMDCLDQFAQGSQELLHYVGLSDPYRLYRALPPLEPPRSVTIFNS
jgi:DDE superfamily endonuclease